MQTRKRVITCTFFAFSLLNLTQHSIIHSSVKQTLAHHTMFHRITPHGTKYFVFTLFICFERGFLLHKTKIPFQYYIAIMIESVGHVCITKHYGVHRLRQCVLDLCLATSTIPSYIEQQLVIS